MSTTGEIGEITKKCGEIGSLQEKKLMDGCSPRHPERAVLAVTVPTTQSGKIVTLPPHTMLDITGPAPPQFLDIPTESFDLKWFDVMIVLRCDGAKQLHSVEDSVLQEG